MAIFVVNNSDLPCQLHLIKEGRTADLRWAKSVPWAFRIEVQRG